jgi:hypothetical protein
MSSFDTYLILCPSCGAQLEFQTKARYGYGGKFEYFTTDPTIQRPVHSTAVVTFGVPEWVRADLVNDERTCRPCGRRVKLDAELKPLRMLNRGRKTDGV